MKNTKSGEGEDSVRGTIMVELKKAGRWVDDAGLRHSVAQEVRAEREVARRKLAQKWEVAKKNKDVLLTQLVAFEKMARDLDRARSLRRFLDEIGASKAAPAELVGSLELMALMADWLAPLVNALWPEVDGIGDKNPHGSLW